MDNLTKKKILDKRQKRIDQLEKRFADLRKKPLTTKEFLQNLFEIRDGFTLLLAIKTAQQTVAGTAQCVHLIEKTHYMIDSIQPVKKTNDKLASFGLDFDFDEKEVEKEVN